MAQGLTSVAYDRKTGMTLAELEKFIANAKILELPADTVVKATVGFVGQIKTLETR